MRSMCARVHGGLRSVPLSFTVIVAAAKSRTVEFGMRGFHAVCARCLARGHRAEVAVDPLGIALLVLAGLRQRGHHLLEGLRGGNSFTEADISID